MNTPINISELVALCAVDDQLYCKTFFPRTYRQDFPAFHDDMLNTLENSQYRYVAFKMFRGSAKTTRIRTFTSKRIAYGISKTIIFVSNAQKHAGYSLKWIRRQVDFNTQWAQTFKLKRGSVWNDEQIEIIHGIDEYPINVLALGITGQVRGINLDDFRPDLILVDDPDNEETTNTPEQREKTSDLVFGALGKSLAPPTEAPSAKMVLAQTPFNSFDLITTCESDPSWHTVEIGCFDNQGESTWPARFPTQFLLQEKQSHIRLNKLSLWMREMECKIVAKETASFDVAWLRYWDEKGLPPGLRRVISIDPASSEAKEADDQVVGLIGFKGKDVYVVDYTDEKGEMPEAAAVTFTKYLTSYAIHKAYVEKNGYQRVLAWYLEKVMKSIRKWITITLVEARGNKADRIIQALRDTAANGNLWVSVKHAKFIQQFGDFAPGKKMHDDVLDMVAQAIIADKLRLIADEEEGAIEGDFYKVDENYIPVLERAAETFAP